MSDLPVVMSCRLCGLGLTLEHRKLSGRYACPTCAPTSQEAALGWLPVHRPAASTPEGTMRAEGLQRVLQGDPMWAKDAHGTTMTRDQKCLCGVVFQQTLLSERFLEIIERHSRRAIDTMLREVPGFYVPVYCPACERRELGRMARAADLRASSVLDPAPDRNHAPLEAPDHAA